MLVNDADQICIIRLAYYGPSLAGKTTNLIYLQEQAPTHSATPIYINTINDQRTLHTRIDAPHLQAINGYRIQFQLVCVPGQGFYNTSQRHILKGADAVVFIADSRREAIDENIESLNDMWSFFNQLSLSQNIPVVMQLNKQDDPNCVLFEQLNPLLNSQMFPSFKAIANTGQGVQETYMSACQAAYDYALGTQAFDNAEKISKETLAKYERIVYGSESPSGTQTLIEDDEDDSWILTCYHCESILEVKDPFPGSVFTCGNCQSLIEVVDPDTGVTKEPKQVPQQASMPRMKAVSGEELPSATYSAIPTPIPEGMRTAAAAPAEGQIELDPPSSTDNSPLAVDLSPSGGHTPVENTMLAGGNMGLPSLPDYQLTDQLDGSLIGTRFRGRQISKDRWVRLLQINPVLVRQPGYRDSIESYARSTSTVKHEGILGLISLQWHGEIPLLITHDKPEYEALSAKLARDRTMPPQEAIEIIRQLAFILDAADRQSACHQWIRPEVVLINDAGKVILDDLHVPKNTAFLIRESMGGSAATEYYLAPEYLHEANKLDHRSDMFLLGCLLFRMITGEGLVTGYNGHEALHKIGTSGPRQLIQAQPKISRDLNAFCTKLCAADRNNRFGNYKELIDTINNFNAGVKKKHAPPPSGSSAMPNRGMNPNIATVTQRRRTGAGDRGASRAGRNSHRDLHNGPSVRKGKKKSSNTLLWLVILVIAVGGTYFYLERQQLIKAYTSYQEDNNSNTSQAPEQKQTPKQAQQTANQSSTTSQSTEANNIATEDPKNDSVQTVNPVITHNETETKTPTSNAVEEKNDNTPKTIDPLATIRPRIEQFRQEPLNAELYQSLRDNLDVFIRDSQTRVEANAMILEITRLRDEAKDKADKVVVKEQPENIRLKVAQLLREQRYQMAFDVVDNEVTDDELKKFYRQLIPRQYAEAKRRIEEELKAVKNPNAIPGILKPVRENWGFNDDKIWADKMEIAIRDNLANTAITDNSTHESVVQNENNNNENNNSGLPLVDSSEPLALPTTINGVSRSLINQFRLIEEPLRLHDKDAVAQQLLAWKTEETVFPALTLYADLWLNAPSLLSKPFKERGIKFRMTTNFAEEKWGLLDFTKDGLVLESPGGGQTKLPWSQVSIDEMGKLFQAIAKHGKNANEHATASIACLLGGNTGQARISASRAQKAYYTKQQDLEQLLKLHQSQDTHKLLSAIEQAIINDNRAQVQSLQEQLQPLDFLEKESTLTAITSYLGGQ